MTEYHPNPGQYPNAGAGQAGAPGAVPANPGSAYPGAPDHPAAPPEAAGQPGYSQPAPAGPQYPVWSPANYGPGPANPYGPANPMSNDTTAPQADPAAAGAQHTGWLPPVPGATGYPTGQPVYNTYAAPQPQKPGLSTAWKLGVAAAAAGALLAATVTGFGAGVLFAHDGSDEASVRTTGDGLPQIPGLTDQGGQGQSDGSGTQTLPQPGTQDGSGNGVLPDGSGSQDDLGSQGGGDAEGDSGQWSIPGFPGFPDLGQGSQGQGSQGQGSQGQGSQDDGFPGFGAQGGTQTESLSATAAAAVQAITPSVVNIDVSIGYGAGAGAGTGIVLTADGKVLTNAHVVSGANELEGTVVGNGKTYPVTVLGYDTTNDVALVQLEGASGLTPAQLANSDNLAVGDLVVGVGNAGGDGGEPTSVEGTITEKGATITASNSDGSDAETLHNLIGTNANIQAGQSGGPMVDADGKVIGMNTAASVGGGFAGRGQSTGYAIPINDALQIANQIDAGKSSDTIHIGPTAFLGVQVGDSTGQGVAIAGVVDNSAAAKAGLAKGDTILSIDGVTVSSGEGLSDAIRAHKAGDTVTVVYLDGSGNRKSVQVTLGSGPAA